jgi:hypothetical protein
MATPEFEQTGRTSGQRLTSERLTVPRGTGTNPQVPGQAGADRFVANFFAQEPGLDPANQPPPVSRFEDLTDGELRRALQQLQGTPHRMDPDQEDALNELGIF